MYCQRSKGKLSLAKLRDEMAFQSFYFCLIHLPINFNLLTYLNYREQSTLASSFLLLKVNGELKLDFLKLFA